MNSKRGEELDSHIRDLPEYFVRLLRRSRRVPAVTLRTAVSWPLTL